MLVAANFTALTASSRGVLPQTGIERLTISLVAPFQRMFSKTLAFSQGIWTDYFVSVRAAKENPILRRELAQAMDIRNRCLELQLENERLRKFIEFQNPEGEVLVAAKVIGRSPSPWVKTIMIDKGSNDGLTRGLPVMVSEGIVGQIITVSEHFSQVLLVTDRNSAVDALVQTSRARGIVKGNNSDQCSFCYALRKDEIQLGEMIISSGLDGVFSKGLRIGQVVDVKKENSELFQTILLKTCVDFDKLEEVLVSIKPDAPGKDA
ncbi:MAG: rod shape-determining protein MreC [Pseudomonadota bacterium]